MGVRSLAHQINLIKAHLPTPLILHHIRPSSPLNLHQPASASIILPSNKYTLQQINGERELTSAFLPSFNVYATVPKSIASSDPDPKGKTLVGVCSLDATAAHNPFLTLRISDHTSAFPSLQKPNTTTQISEVTLGAPHSLNFETEVTGKRKVQENLGLNRTGERIVAITIPPNALLASYHQCRVACKGIRILLMRVRRIRCLIELFEEGLYAVIYLGVRWVLRCVCVRHFDSFLIIKVGLGMEEVCIVYIY
jgi:hypothetical protein